MAQIVFVPPEKLCLPQNNVTLTEDLHCLSNELTRDSSGQNQGRNTLYVVRKRVEESNLVPQAGDGRV